jgi:hypothetical protein
MSKQTSISIRGGGKQIAPTAPAQMRMRELYETINNYSKYNPFAKVVIAKMQEDLNILQEAIIAGNIRLFWKVYNKVAKRLLEHGIVLPSYVKYSFRLR